MSPISYKSLTAQFRNTLNQWQKPLFGLIHHLQPTNQILQTSQNNGTILLVSNTSVQNSKQSGFVWVINHKDTKLWQGVGITPGPAVDIYLGRAEAFGLIAGLTFLRHYVASYEPTQFHASPLYCFCDNLGVVTNVNKLLSSTVKRPNDTTNDNWDVYMAISTLAQACHPLLPQFFHVKGHQDLDPCGQLTRTKKLNVDCNK